MSTVKPWDALPPHWQEVRAKALFSERRESCHSTDVHLTPSQRHGVLPQTEYMARTGARVVLNLAGQDSMKHVEPGDFIIHLRSFQGGLECSPQAGKVSTAYTVLKPGSQVHVGFFRWLFKSDRYISALAGLTNQLRDGQSIKFADFARIDLPLPPPDEQRRIADFLDDQVALLDKAVSLEREAIQLHRERLDASREELLVRADGMSRTPLHRLVDPKRAISYGMVQAGPHVADGIPYIKTGDMLDFHPETLSRAAIEIESAYRRARVHPGDLVIAMRASIGALVEVPESLPVANLTQGTARIAPAPGIDRAWLRQVLLSRHVQEDFQNRAVGSTFRTLNLWDLRRVSIPVPAPQKMAELGRLMSAEQAIADTLVSLREEQIRLLIERKQALVTAVVTGQFDVTTARLVSVA